MKQNIKARSVVFVLFSFILICGITVIAVTGNSKDIVREPAVAGAFYPGDPKELGALVDQYMNNAHSVEVGGNIIGLVVPHAGYVFSAKTAAVGYKCVAGNKYDVVIIMAPSHRDPIQGATIFPGDAYNTPLGNVPIDKDLSDELIKTCRYIQYSNFGHTEEHAIEVQLPFVQKLFPETKIIPIVIGQYNWNICKNLGKSIAQLVRDKKVLLIASSDLYHGDSYDNCKTTDTRTLTGISQFNPEQFFNGIMSDTYQACGGGPIVVMQIAAQELGANKAKLLSQTNSGDVTGRKTGYIVGYGTVAVYKNSTTKTDKIEFNKVDISTQKELLTMARESIEYYLKNKSLPVVEPKNEVMQEKRGVFVTITISGMLRGCIGHHESDMPLYQLVPQMAAAAAFGDPRFPPLSGNELKKIRIKISVYLTNVYKIDTLDEFEMGVHGIIMSKNGRAATYLPEVPLEAGWKTVDEEMESLCRKAGLPNDAWKEGAEFRVYRTQVFDESIL
ncbi:AmmeMemoRadiSam system protein B [candidate division KSB1 bacterium]|nr:AmmeMemoRadiSam system protein B [candidate division KSB1 bacterium]